MTGKETSNEYVEYDTSDEIDTKTGIVAGDTDNEVIKRLTAIETKLSVMEERLSRVEHMEEMLAEILRRLPATDTGEIRYTHTSPEFVAQLRTLKGSNVTQFALDLEAEIYKDDASELDLPVERRLKTKDKVIFLRQCVNEYYSVPQHLKEATWKRVREALDSRVRRLRKRVRDVQGNPSSQSNLPDGLNF
ncbi:unnamed protein product [Cylicostephanus goldi]|uniref:Uncharacterized protein n=1 Tax=Cylicostephanus goldi TaxID=71465 RepID=A0A3P7MH78_CYLGO|nr:unnamed protein product [Cylicostephanus goldi]